MGRKFVKISLAAGTIFAAASATLMVFHTHFIKVTIDYLSFAAGLFLMLEAAYAITRSKEKFFPNQLSRIARALVGAFVFLTHLDQFIRYRVVTSTIAEITIDWKDYAALTAGLFLVTEGILKIIRSDLPIFPNQMARVFRILLGAILITIHVLQFIHCWGNL